MPLIGSSLIPLEVYLYAHLLTLIWFRMQEEFIRKEKGASILLKTFGNSPKIRIIDFFLGNPLLDFTKKEVIEALGMSKQTFYKYFKDLEELGIVKVTRRIGKAKLYRINLKHPLIAMLREYERKLSLQIVEKERDKIKEILKEFKTEIKELYGKRLKKVILYGSWARGEATEDSDIDVLIVLEGKVLPGREIDRMIDIITKINLKYGVLISVYPVSEKDFHEVRSPLLMNIRKEGIPA